MDNSYHGSSSSRKGKKGNSDKPKQPQRGLGVAQLEKIRLHGQMASSGYNNNLPLHYGPCPASFNQEDNMGVQQMGYSSMASSSSFSYSSTSPAASYGFQYPNTMMGVGEYDQRGNFRYGDSQPSTTASWNTSSGILESQHFAQPNMTRQLLNPHDEDSRSRSKKHRSSSLGSSSQNSESSDTQELDLELRLSL
ncbi:Elongation factor Ts isoform 1 [Hibiscus syriacus]|uniref:Elongation factor Ts isoform 1 n=1 Tax=Hibiscus syriacus TaxID=106335 RepID=A0A6A3D0Q4_HIBSY|nr:protein SPEAR1-like [Hibiscus syriacus]KAE8735385.1 Elongation factor Ts isoform 1 [Hibiscus syriacus]